MNAKQKLHQSKLAQWAIRCKEQADSGLTVKAWCDQNDVSVYTYNYWKHQLKSEYIDSLLPDIVPISLPPAAPPPSLPADTACSSLAVSGPAQSRDSRDCTSMHISTPDIDISVNSTASDALILEIIKAVRHA